MPASIRTVLLLLPLLGFAFWGSYYSPDSSEKLAESAADVVLVSLPPLPAWAREPLPDFSVYSDITEKKAAFFSYLYPRIVLANSRVLIERENLLALQQKPELSKGEQTWLADQAKRLRVNAELGSETMFTALMNSLDVIPPSLVLAQAANESGWGTSRFAREGNNLFGQWCFSKGCGLVPASRAQGASHEVVRFSSPYGSVRAYVQNLNRHASYKALRSLREQHRVSGHFPDGITLAAGLLNYSERGQPYVREIRGMIRFNNLSFYDREFSKSLDGQQLQALNKLITVTQPNDLLPSVVSEDTIHDNAAEG